jgi:peptidyl-prolyl cis-trans isomerase B (cyclophilin B)
MKSIKILLVIFMQLTFLLSACSDGSKNDNLITIKTKYGDMKAILFDETPKHKANFIKLAKEGFYDSLLFHRVMENFMIQTGDPDSKGAKPGIMLGKGGPSYTIPAEIRPGFIHQKGALAAARQSDNINPERASSGSQFYIVQGKVYTKPELDAAMLNYNELYKDFNTYLRQPENKTMLDFAIQLQKENRIDSLQKLILSKKDLLEQQFGVKYEMPLTDQQIQKYTTVGGVPHLDGAYTVFGQVIDGLDVIDKIAAVKTDSNNRPLDNVVLAVTVTEMPKKKITKLYGYQYPEEPKK